jgi:hypothetical protein
MVPIIGNWFYWLQSRELPFIGPRSRPAFKILILRMSPAILFFPVPVHRVFDTGNCLNTPLK